MKNNSRKIILFFVVFSSLFFSCEDLTEVNINKNAVEPTFVDPNLVMPSVLTEAGKLYVNLGYQDIAGVVQHTQKDAWSSGHNDYDWGGSQDWSGYYGILRDNDLVYKRSVELGWEFHQGVSLVMKSFMFGLITDLWGDAPYTNALNGDLGGLDNTKPSFDSQETIYKGIIADLEAANILLSKTKAEYLGITNNAADPYFAADPAAWRRFANSLMLRYYMRVSDKLTAEAKSGIEKIVANPSQYPVITTNTQDVTMTFPGSSTGTAWPANTVFDASESNYKRIKMCNTLVESLQAKKDPRLGVWAKKVAIPLVVDPSLPAGTDKIVSGVRYLSPDKVGATPIDTDPEYVGMPPSFSALPSTYNFNPTPGQTSNNPHVSFLSDLYKKASDPLLRSRLISAAEVNFVLAEAALKGWSVGATAQAYYENGIKASLATWGKSADYATYVAGANVAYNGTLGQIIEQKWIASWTAATEAWFDFRRTGLPALKAGPVAKRSVLPVRFYFSQDELKFNTDNTLEATSKLEVTSYSQADAKNSAWSKPWLIQGTGKPW